MPAGFANFFEQALLLLVHMAAVYSKPLLVHRYLRRTKVLPFFAVPRTINEKFLWRKLFDHDPRFTVISDKLACKDYIQQRAPNLRIAKVLRVIDHPEEILQLSDEFLQQAWVLKSSHGSGDVLVMPNGSLDRSLLVARAKRMLRTRHGRAHHEWGYFDVPRRVFFEEYIQPSTKLSELKTYTFGRNIGRMVQIGGRFGTLWSQAWEPGLGDKLVPSAESATLAPAVGEPALPANAEQAMEVAAQLGQCFDHMRVDLLTDGQDLWFGELTVYNRAGYYTAPSGGSKSGGMTLLWDIRRSYCLTARHKHRLFRLYSNVLRAQLEKKPSA